MSTSAEPEFINRDQEIDFLLRSLLRVDEPAPALLVIRGPSGWGKSRLTEQLVTRCRTEIPRLLFCVLEPEAQVHADTSRLHDGFFLQRCAEQLSRMAESKTASWPTFSEFLDARRWQTLKSKKKEDWISDMPGFKSAYKIALDYAFRAFSLGTYAPGRILAAESKEAVAICTEYAESVLIGHRVALVIRETQHCDIQSMRTFLEWGQTSTDLDIILEYTTQRDFQFDAAHRKLLTRAAGKKHNFKFWNLEPLGGGHLEQVIRSCIDSSFSITPEAYESWDGNLHSLLEIQFQVSIGHHIVSPLQIEQALGNLPSMLSAHLDRLPSLQRLLLATCLAHVESIQEDMLQQAVQAIVPTASALQIKKALIDLTETHRFLNQREGAYRIHVEAVIDALHGLASFRSVLAIAEKALRDLYCRQVFDANWTVSGMSIAVRQVFRLCARTHDAVGMLRAANVLSKDIARAQDRSLYAEIVASAVSANSALYGDDQDRLLLWAASLAYDVGNFEISESLLAAITSPDEASDLMRACALQECGRHDQALQIAMRLRATSVSSEVRLAAELIEALIAGCRGEFDRARDMLARVIAEPAYEQSPLLGFAYRFYEVTEENDACIEKIQTSIAWFKRFGMEKSRAYSQAAAAVLLARTGDIAAARAMISSASEILGEQVRSHHLLLNNVAAVELLSSEPNFSRCVEVLVEALRYVRDDYCEVTVLTNLALAHCGAGHKEQAVECIDSALHILEDHDFASVDIYWQVCFNAAQVLEAAGQPGRSAQILRWPEGRAPAPVQNKPYWDYRYRRTTNFPESWRYLAERSFHPLYLSNWLIDLDGFNHLRPALLQ